MFILEFSSLISSRLDKLITFAFENISRSRLQGLITDGYVKVNDNVTTQASIKVKHHDKITIDAQKLYIKKSLDAEAIPLDICFEDDDYLVINKGIDMVVHPAPGHEKGTLVHALLHHCGDHLRHIGDDPERPGIVHRLDKDTTGLMVIAKTQEAFDHLKQQFRDKLKEDSLLSRKYYALVYGLPSPSSHMLEGYIGRDPKNRTRRAMLNEKTGKYALTSYEVEETYGFAFSLLSCSLYTGRTHQIRVQLADYGFPVIGDPFYVTNRSRIKKRLQKHPKDLMLKLNQIHRQMLHAYELQFQHIRDEKPMQFQVKIPADMQLFLDYLKNL